MTGPTDLAPVAVPALTVLRGERYVWFVDALSREAVGAPIGDAADLVAAAHRLVANHGTPVDVEIGELWVRVTSTGRTIPVETPPVVARKRDRDERERRRGHRRVQRASGRLAPTQPKVASSPPPAGAPPGADDDGVARHRAE